MVVLAKLGDPDALAISFFVLFILGVPIEPVIARRSPIAPSAIKSWTYRAMP